MNRILTLFFAVLVWCSCGRQAAAADSYAAVIASVQPKTAKIFGAGGLRGLEHYQSGFLISPQGHVLTVWSYVLDTEGVAVVLDDGRRFEATLLGADPRVEIAVLKIEANDLPHFPLQEAVAVEPGDRVLTFSNLFGVATGDEDTSVLHGYVAAKTSLAARRGTYETPYRGTAYVLDAIANNPGAAGGVLTDRKGKLAGMLGKELRNSQDNTWLNYAIPIVEIAGSVQEILAGQSRPRERETTRKPLQAVSLFLLGISLVPDVLPRTPPFIDGVVPGSPAAKAGLRADDLVLFVNDRVASSIRTLQEELSYVDRIDEVRLVVQRGQELVQVSLFAADR